MQSLNKSRARSTKAIFSEFNQLAVKYNAVNMC